MCEQHVEMAVRFLRHALYVSQCEFTLSCSHFLRWQKKKCHFHSHMGKLEQKLLCVCVCGVMVNVDLCVCVGGGIRMNQC